MSMGKALKINGTPYSPNLTPQKPINGPTYQQKWRPNVCLYQPRMIMLCAKNQVGLNPLHQLRQFFGVLAV